MTQTHESEVHDEEKDGKGHGHTVEITINDKEFHIHSPILGSELRALGQIPTANQLFEERPGPDLLIEPNETYKVKPHTHFYDLPTGTVGR